jgi:hypothetical protein
VVTLSDDVVTSKRSHRLGSQGWPAGDGVDDVDGVDGVDAAVAGTDEVGADAAEPAEGEGGVPVA